MGTVEVGTVVERVHLVDANAAQAVCGGFDRIEHRNGLAVGERHDQVGAVLDVLEDVPRRPKSGLLHRTHDQLLRAERRRAHDE
jgi:hypothetical protein